MSRSGSGLGSDVAGGTARVAELGRQFVDADRKASSLALRELIRLGRDATAVLVDALRHADPRTRRLAAEGLSEVADPHSADALFQATQDPNGEVRARAATALHRIGDPRALDALIATLNDYPDELHNPYTASMYPLMSGGKAVLPAVVPLLQSADAPLRERALLIIKAVVGRQLPELDWQALWQALGAYDAGAPQAARDAAAIRWQEWVRQQV